MNKQWMLISVIAGLLSWGSAVEAQYALVPGTGQQVDQVGDDFEDANWSYQFNLPKCQNHKDAIIARNKPGGTSANGRWYEGMKRGQPDVVRRVQPPEGGLPGSQGALLLCSLRTGGAYPSNTLQQEDLIANVFRRIGKIQVSRGPSVVTRVWMPPFEEWENRVGQCHFAFRLSLEKPSYGMQAAQGSNSEHDHFWPGIFVNLSRNPKAREDGHPFMIDMWMKATADGRAMRGPRSTQTGWWTLGMSVTPDGKCHFYGKPGTDDLTQEDHLGSSFPFGNQAVLFRNFFFNVCNGDNGQTWSSQFVIDDPTMYVAK